MASTKHTALQNSDIEEEKSVATSKVASRFTTTEVLPSKTPPAEKLGGAGAMGKSPMNSTHVSGIGAAMKKMGFS
jgi:hypothetical protein